jgi:hypothetical protein
MDNSDEVAKLLDSVEKLSIKDITSILNKATEMFSKGDVSTDRYNEILINIAKKAEGIASDIYHKTHTAEKINNLDLAEYRTLLDISRECRDGVRDVELNRRKSSTKSAGNP